VRLIVQLMLTDSCLGKKRPLQGQCLAPSAILKYIEMCFRLHPMLKVNKCDCVDLHDELKALHQSSCNRIGLGDVALQLPLGTRSAKATHRYIKHS